MKRIVWAVLLTSLAWNWHITQKFYPEGIGIDFKYYYHAAQGDTRWVERQPGYESYSPEQKATIGWMYDDRLAVLWKPFTLLSLPVATAVWMVGMHACTLILLTLVMRTRYGWIAALAAFRPMVVVLVSGNVTPVLGLLVLHPLGVALATCVKPYLAGFMVIHILRRYRKWRMEKARIVRHGHLDSPGSGNPTQGIAASHPLLRHLGVGDVNKSRENNDGISHIAGWTPDPNLSFTAYD